MAKISTFDDSIKVASVNMDDWSTYSIIMAIFGISISVVGIVIFFCLFFKIVSCYRYLMIRFIRFRERKNQPNISVFFQPAALPPLEEKVESTVDVEAEGNQDDEEAVKNDDDNPRHQPKVKPTSSYLNNGFHFVMKLLDVIIQENINNINGNNYTGEPLGKRDPTFLIPQTV